MHYALSYTDAPSPTVEPTSGSHDMAMFGGYSKPERVELANGPTSSACCAGLSEDE